MIGDIHLEIYIEGRSYRISELLTKDSFMMSEGKLIVSYEVYKQLHRMLKRICDQCYIEEMEIINHKN